MVLDRRPRRSNSPSPTRRSVWSASSSASRWAAGARDAVQGQLRAARRPVRSGPPAAVPESGVSKVFKIVSLTGKPLSIVLKDLGYKLGHVSLDGLADARRHAARLRQHGLHHYRGVGLGRGTQRHAVFLVQRRRRDRRGRRQLERAGRQRDGQLGQRLRHPRAPLALPAQRRRLAAALQDRRRLPQAQVRHGRHRGLRLRQRLRRHRLGHQGVGLRGQGQVRRRRDDVLDRGGVHQGPPQAARRPARRVRLLPGRALAGLPARRAGRLVRLARAGRRQHGAQPRLDLPRRRGDGAAQVAPEPRPGALAAGATAPWPTGCPRRTRSPSASAPGSRSTAAARRCTWTSSSSSPRARPRRAC